MCIETCAISPASMYPPGGGEGGGGGGLLLVTLFFSQLLSTELSFPSKVLSVVVNSFSTRSRFSSTPYVDTQVNCSEKGILSYVFD